MVNLSTAGRRAALAGVFCIALPMIGMADPMTRVRCALASGAMLAAEADAAVKRLAEAHAALLQPPEGWTCQQGDLAGKGTQSVDGAVEFTCQRDTLAATVSISGGSSVKEMLSKVKQGWPKTFRRDEYLFSRGPWKLVILDGAIFGVLDQVAGVKVTSVGGTRLSETDLLEFVASFNRPNQRLVDFFAEEARYRAAKDALDAMSITRPAFEADLTLLLGMMPSVGTYDSQGTQRVEEPNTDEGRATAVAAGFTKTSPWAFVALVVPAPGEELGTELSREIHQCRDGLTVPPENGSCRKHGDFLYWLGSGETESQSLRSALAIVEIGGGAVLTIATFEPSGGPMSEDALEKLFVAPTTGDTIEKMGQELTDLGTLISSTNDTENLPKVVETILDEFKLQGLDRLDLGRHRVQSGECQ